MTQLIIIPNYLIPHLASSENKKKILRIQNSHDCQITVTSSQDAVGRVVSITGTPSDCSKTLYQFNKELINIETLINGQRKI